MLFKIYIEIAGSRQDKYVPNVNVYVYVQY